MLSPAVKILILGVNWIGISNVNREFVFMFGVKSPILGLAIL